MNWTSSPDSGGSIEDLSLTKAYKNNQILFCGVPFSRVFLIGRTPCELFALSGFSHDLLNEQCKT